MACPRRRARKAVTKYISYGKGSFSTTCVLLPYSRVDVSDTSSAKLYAASLSGSMYRPRVAGERWFENAWRAGSPRLAVFISRDALVIGVE